MQYAFSNGVMCPAVAFEIGSEYNASKNASANNN